MPEQYHGRKQTRKGTGAKFARHGVRRLSHLGGHFAGTKVAEKNEVETVRKRGGSKKVVSLYIGFANVVMHDKKIKKAKIKTVLESPNNAHYKRMNIITKGVIIETDVGKARVTNRPGQEGVVNAVLIKS
ncbi:30S ribosomal protein S8e [uncultured archaeon]|nr:30S ribosomal protein S8e [uncultured archaeon]